jgi:hypothetical protein
MPKGFTKRRKSLHAVETIALWSDETCGKIQMVKESRRKARLQTGAAVHAITWRPGIPANRVCRGRVREWPRRRSLTRPFGDILVLEALFKRICAKFESNAVADIKARMIQISQSPVLVSRMPYGRYKSRHFADVPRDYLEWLSSTALDEDMAFTVNHYLNKVAT